MKRLLEKIYCYHCGEACTDEAVALGDIVFCCPGCKLVYEILQENNLCSYYSFNKAPGVKKNNLTGSRFRYLDDPSVHARLIQFRNKNEERITFHIPTMHCSSCIWLLENFRKIDPGVITTQVHFLKKEVLFIFDNTKTSLRHIVEQLTQTGYEPSLHLNNLHEKTEKRNNRSRIIRIGIAGFCFGNIMMLSFPEYFSSGNIAAPGLKQFFSYMNLILALPVFFYSASEFFIRSFRALKHRTTVIDIPIAIGIVAIFLRSAYEILSGTGAGYFDSGSGLVFFMLIGRWFQDFTFDALAYDRDYRSYFPIAVTAFVNGLEKDVPVNDLKINDKILIRHNEILPVDATLLKGEARIDYHFVTGESQPVHHRAGDTLFAGGRQMGGIITLQVNRVVSQSYLTQLWNNNFNQRIQSTFETLVNGISKYFVIATIAIAMLAAAYWWRTDTTKAVNAFTAVLVIACPCALALSAPFTYGNIIRMLGRKKIYLRDYHTLEKLADINHIVFDKTGTLTENNAHAVTYTGLSLTADEKLYVVSVLRQSSHPLSKAICKSLNVKFSSAVSAFDETPGKGISGMVDNQMVKAGSYEYVCEKTMETPVHQTRVYISINNEYKGYFVLSNKYRNEIPSLIESLAKKKYSMTVLTGDNENEKENLVSIFGIHAEIKCNQSPDDKFRYITNLQKENKKVLMLGDGLNDAGALMASDAGISVTDNTNAFTPSSDGIIDAGSLVKVGNMLALSKAAVRIIIISFILSLLYNFIGLSFAVTGTLSPLIAAILMPISTISLVLFTVVSSSIKAKTSGF